MIDRSECERFLIHEARLLDDRRFRDWMALFTEDGSYWVPASVGQASLTCRSASSCARSMLAPAR